MDAPRLRERVGQDEQDALIAAVLERALEAGEESRQARPRPAAGAARGGRRRRRRLRPDGRRRGRDRRAARGRSAASSSTTRPRGSRTRSTSPRPTATARTSPSTGEDLDPAGLIPPLEQLGDSVLVVGERTTLKVHVHTDEPEARGAVRRAPAWSPISTSPTCASRCSSARARLAEAGRRPAACWPWSTATGMARAVRGRRRVRRSTAGRRSTRRPTSCWPASTRCRPRRSWCCRTRPTCCMAAERAAELSDKHVRVVPSRSSRRG